MTGGDPGPSEHDQCSGGAGRTRSVVVGQGSSLIDHRHCRMETRLQGTQENQRTGQRRRSIAPHSTAQAIGWAAAYAALLFVASGAAAASIDLGLPQIVPKLVNRVVAGPSPNGRPL